jgi:hypothetical protein
MQLMVKYFFLAGILFLGVILELDKYTFPWQMSVGGILDESHLAFR